MGGGADDWYQVLKRGALACTPPNVQQCDHQQLDGTADFVLLPNYMHVYAIMIQ